MKKYPALALLELSTISSGLLTGDAIIKAAPISVLKSGTVHNGKFLLLFGGSVASVEESYNKGLFIGGDNIISSVFLPNVHEKIYNAILGKRNEIVSETLGMFETTSVANVIKSSDAAVKGATVEVVELRIADDIGGKGLVVFNGKIEEVEIALEIAKEKLDNNNSLFNSSIISNIHNEMAKQLDISSSYRNNGLKELEGGEL